MLFLVHMQVQIPADTDKAFADALKAEEKAFSQKLQQEGKWRHLWRVVGEYANYSVFDVESNDELHTMLSALPLFPFMKISVTPLAQHPSAIAPN
ncbi:MULTISPECIES: muconolactone Delta-isomerase [Paraburkholderia]|jgi:muconolactone D-isomerase|uniref:Muconolactone Delta-isomerase n=1 Tax=Paraburkholderia tropica TaxID=92647 RepID=A0A1A5XKZ5_9BURK|nr:MULTISPECIES: muconolactone Delta-isomerase [Paraburkholderia]MBB2978892.1 muconolactone D-isomerase [Paraburkholderia tropica]MBB2999278.1 muconolactone D-isomerase [Paraburkholderia tropica]MBB6318822.1 muconolactone D-isomerase [Paraburkholderia tropica]MBN3808330.1 muconolactone Delta-isomerase [Paraburkholderia sp. Ac-20347]MDE1139005.1 muconolactone Delta-isomerase [Paraburkholderia tropica]